MQDRAFDYVVVLSRSTIKQSAITASNGRNISVSVLLDDWHMSHTSQFCQRSFPVMNRREKMANSCVTCFKFKAVTGNETLSQFINAPTFEGLSYNCQPFIRFSNKYKWTLISIRVRHVLADYPCGQLPRKTYVLLYKIILFHFYKYNLIIQ